jgi:hypothetical protein
MVRRSDRLSESFHSETPATSRSRTDVGKSRCIFLRRDKSKQLSVFCLSKIAVVNVRLRVCGSRDSAVNSYRNRAIDFVTGAFGWAPGAAARAMRQSFVQDALDRAGAATALHVAAKAAIDFVRGQRLRSRSSYQVAYRLVAKHVA